MCRPASYARCARSAPDAATLAIRDSLVVHFGLGKAKKIDRIEVRWSGTKSQPQVFEDVDINQRLQLREGGKLEPRR
jgi:hypothetical protein